MIAPAAAVLGVLAVPAQAMEASRLLGLQGGAFAGLAGQAVLLVTLGALVLVLMAVALFALRHGVFLLNRLFGQQHHGYAHVVSMHWPPVTAVVLAANHASTIEACLQGLLKGDYPAPRLQVLVVTDHASDGTQALVENLAQRYPGRVRLLQRDDPEDFGAGAMASLNAAMAEVQTEFVIVLDPAHQPAPGMVRRLMAPFCDAEVGAVAGRLVGRTDPRLAGGVAYGFAGVGLAARLTALERAGVSRVGNQARANLGLASHQAGVWGALRLRAVQSAGGWPTEPAGAEDDLHGRLRLAGWLTVYQPLAELFDEPQDDWASREAQLAEAAHGQQAALRRHGVALLRQRGSSPAGAAMSLTARLEVVLRLAEHWAAPLLLLAWVLTLVLYFFVAPVVTALAVVAMAILSYAVMSSGSAFFEQAAATLLEPPRRRARLLPLGLLAFLGNALAALRGAWGRSQAGHAYPVPVRPADYEESRFEHRVPMHVDAAGRPWMPEPVPAQMPGDAAARAAPGSGQVEPKT